jgi:hypothetical protein
VNRKDRTGNNLYEGGFLGLDNIGVFARSAPLPTGGHLEQADATAWIALFCENMLEIACEIAPHDPVYEDLAANFAIQFLLIARSLNALGAEGMWDEEDGFYYDVLRLPNGTSARLKVRSMVGLLPICATTIIEPVQREKMPKLKAHFADRVRQIPELFKSIHPTGPRHLGVAGRGLIGLVSPERLRRILTRMLDENESLRHPHAGALPCPAPLCLRGRGPGIPGRLPAGRIGQRHVRRQLELARAGVGAGQRAGHPRIVALLRLLPR